MKCALSRLYPRLVVVVVSSWAANGTPVQAALEPVARPHPIEQPAPIRSRPVNIVSPKILTVFVSSDGTARFEGLGTPWSRVTVEVGGAVFGPVNVRPQGLWGIEVARVLGPGEQTVSASAAGAGSERPVRGHEIKFTVPKTFSNPSALVYGRDRSDASAEPVQRLAGVEPLEADARDPIERRRPAAEVQAGTFGPQPIGMATEVRVGASAEKNQTSDTQPSGLIVAWIKTSIAAFQSDIVSRLSQAPSRPVPASPDVIVTAQADPVVPPVKRERPTPPAQPQAEQPQPVQPQAQSQPTAAPPKAADKKPELQPAQTKAAPAQPNPDGVMGNVQDWLARANREYQGIIIKQLSTPPAGEPGPDPIARKLQEDQQAEEAKKAAEAKAADERRKAENAAKVEEIKKAEAARKAEQARRAEELSKAEAAKQAEAAKKTEDSKKADSGKETEEARKAAEAKKAEDLKKAEAAKKIEESRRSDEAKKAEAAKKADEARRAEEARKAESLKASDLAKAQDESKRQEAAKAAAEAQRLKEAEQRRADDDRRKAEEARRAENDRRQAEAKAKEASDKEARAQEEKRRAEEAENAKHRSRTIAITPEPIAPRDKASARDSSGAKSSERVPDTRIPEGSAESGPVEGEKSSADRHHEASNEPSGSWRAHRNRHHHVCRFAGRIVRPPAYYTVARGDSLWRISARHYRAGRHYMMIYRANRSTIADPDLIYPCQRVLVPRRRRH